MDPVNALKNIFEIGQLIYDRAQTVKANKAQCLRLSERVSIVLVACQRLEKIADLEHYRTGLDALELTLTETLKYMTKFAEKNWFKQFLFAGNEKNHFEVLAKNLCEDVQLLQLGIDTQQIVNRDQDKVDISKDMIELQVAQEEILRLNREQTTQLVQIHFDQIEQHKLIERQLASIRDQIAIAACQKKTEKPILNPKLTVPFYQLEFDMKITEGSVATIYKGRWLRTTVAIKLMDRILTDSDIKQFSREVDILSRLHHPNIVQLYCACLESSRACLVMEYMPHDLRKMLEGGVRLLNKEKNQLALSICQGLFYLHQSNVVHRNLRSSNILLSANYQVAKICDFGFAKVDALSVQSAVNIKPVWQYLAPELLMHEGVATVQSDIYSLGIVLWELYTGKIPYDESKLQPTDILMGQREVISPTIPETIATLIKRCWAAKAFERPSLDELMEGFESTLVVKSISSAAESLYGQALMAEKANEHLKAFQLYCEADGLGHPKAKTGKAFYLLTGKGGVLMDKLTAYREMIIAAEEGHGRAQYYAGQILEYGDGVQKSLTEALFYYDLAARQQFPNAAEKRDALKARIQNSAVSVSEPTAKEPKRLMT